MDFGELNRLILASGCFSGATVAGWSVDPAILVPLLLTAALYVSGVVRLWRSAGQGRGTTRLQVLSFAVGWLILALAVGSPLHDLSRKYFAAHMIEHELVMLVAAPLLVLGRPLPVMLWAFPRGWRRHIGQGAGVLAYLVGWEVLTVPLVATVLHAAAIWLWHLPPAFDAALTNELLHWLQHLSFLASSLLFWWVMLELRRPRASSIAFLFLTALHTGFLGVLLAIAPRPLFPAQAQLAVAYGADPLADQQLAGLIMWVPAGLFYVTAGLALAGLWIARSSGGANVASR
jgi:cytochrome c oxidase assembly factor CtaG